MTDQTTEGEERKALDAKLLKEFETHFGIKTTQIRGVPYQLGYLTSEQAQFHAAWIWEKVLDARTENAELRKEHDELELRRFEGREVSKQLGLQETTTIDEITAAIGTLHCELSALRKRGEEGEILAALNTIRLSQTGWEGSEDIMTFNGEPTGATILRNVEIGRWWPELKEKIAKYVAAFLTREEKPKHNSWEASQAKDEVARLRKSISEFEKASGVRIESWGSERLGAAVRFVMDGGIEKQLNEMKRMRESAICIQTIVDEFEHERIANAPWQPKKEK
jgi:hypothetical protein